MQSENFDNKVRQAAEQHHPNYDEKAWSKMETLLDRHLPQKNDRRRIIFFLLFFFLLCGGIWLIISKPWNQNNQSLSVVNTGDKKETRPSVNSTKETKQKSEEENSPAIESPANEKKAAGYIEDAGNSRQKTDNNPAVAKAGVLNSFKQNNVSGRKNSIKDDQLTMDITNPATAKQDRSVTINNSTTNTTAAVTSPANNDKAAKNENSKIVNSEPGNIDLVRDNKVVEEKKDNLTDQSKKENKKEVSKQSNNKKHNSFFFSFSLGPDKSSIGLDNPGKVKLLAGAGIGYSFKDRWMIRTGFYTASKVYSASKEQYKPSSPPYNYNYLDKIDANCKVYEIPLNLSYNFSRSDKHSWFATTGLSSFIMKKEVYKYLYKYPGNPPTTYTYTKTINNENKHYFSVLTLSGGYQRNINKTFSIAAEPYIKVPLAGVGFGKVKLNSAGVLISANIRPFH
jgi:hypothetical protein